MKLLSKQMHMPTKKLSIKRYFNGLVFLYGVEKTNLFEI